MDKVLFAIFFLKVITHADAFNPCEGRHLEFVNDYSSCRHYFSCVNGIAYRIECPGGRWFYTNPLGCHIAGTVTCDVCPSEGIFSFPKEESCMEYRLCINGQPLEMECAPGTRFSREENRCMLQENVECDYLVCPDNERTIVADPSDPTCQQYIVCIDGIEMDRRRCNDNLLFDPVLRSCSRAENVNCHHAPIINPFSIEKAAMFTSAPTGTPTPPPNIVREWPTEPITCPPTGIHYYGHHLLCTVFQVCANGVLHQVNCPPNQHWSTEFGFCEFPDRANCTVSYNI